jgi:hypothetical protein
MRVQRGYPTPFLAPGIFYTSAFLCLHSVSVHYEVPYILFVLALVASSASPHPGPHPIIAGSDIQKRGAISKRCASAAAALNEKRYNKRNFERKRELVTRANKTYSITTDAPYYEVIRNDTCVRTLEVTEGPYVWQRSQTLRQDMTERQLGVSFWLDVGFLDMATCGPLENVAN